MKNKLFTKMVKCCVILLCCLFIAEIFIGIFACLHYKEIKPCADMIGTIQSMTYSSGSHNREIEIKEKDINDMRSSLLKINLYGPCLKRHFRSNKEALLIYTNTGEKHTIVFEGRIKILRWSVGIVDYDGDEYLCDEWLVNHFKYICERFKYT